MRKNLFSCLIALSLILSACSPFAPPPAVQTPSPTVEQLTPFPTATSVPHIAPSGTLNPPLSPPATPTVPTTPVPTTSILATPTPVPALIALASLPNTTIVFYQISGSTAGELRSQMNALGPIDQFGRRGDAYTRWDISWRWPRNTDGTCQLGNATVTYSIRVTFPQWIPPANAPPTLVTKWTNYIEALATHEKGHADFVVQTIPSILDSIKNSTCDTANQAAQAVTNTIKQHDVDYDAATGHGATQGAIFP